MIADTTIKIFEMVLNSLRKAPASVIKYSSGRTKNKKSISSSGNALGCLPFLKGLSPIIYRKGRIIS